MASLLEALQASMQAQQLSRQLAISLPLIEAMLERLIAMGKVVRIEQGGNECLNGCYKGCPQGQDAVPKCTGCSLMSQVTLQTSTSRITYSSK